MAYTVGTPSSTSQAGSATSIATPGTLSVSTGDSIIVFLTAAQDQTAAFAASDGTNSYTLRQSVYDGSALSAGILVAENVTAGTYTVTGSWSGSRTSNAIFAVGVSGLKPSSYQTGATARQPTPGTGTDGITTGNMTPTEQPACVIGLIISFATLTAPTEGTGFTSVATGWQYGTGTDLARLEHKQITSTSPVALTGTAAANTSHWSLAVILSESGAGGAGLSIPATYRPQSVLLRM